MTWRRITPALRVRHHVHPVTVGTRATVDAVWGISGTVIRRPVRLLGVDPLRTSVRLTVIGSVGAYFAGTADDATNGLGTLVKPGALPWDAPAPTAELWAITEYPFLDPDVLIAGPLSLLPAITIALTSEIQQICQ